RMRNVGVVLFDKTGTLTEGRHVVTAVIPAPGWDEDQLLALAGAAESDSEHPVARAIVQAARARGPLPTSSDFQSMTGRGVRAEVGGALIEVGGPNLLRSAATRVPAEVEASTGQWVDRGASVLHVLADGKVIGALALEDSIRAESRQAVDE